jgi:hypothetical protein
MQGLHTAHPMSFVRPLPTRALAGRALLCLLLAGLLLHGQAQLLRQVLGAAHWHTLLPLQADTAADPAPGQGWPDWLTGLRHLHQEVRARSPLGIGHAVHGHHHDASARHHHGPGDATVVALEPLHDRAASLSDGAAGSLLQPLGLATGLVWRPPQTADARWPTALAPGWRNATLRLPERPPRA